MSHRQEDHTHINIGFLCVEKGSKVFWIRGCALKCFTDQMVLFSQRGPVHIASCKRFCWDFSVRDNHTSKRQRGYSSELTPLQPKKVYSSGCTKAQMITFVNRLVSHCWVQTTTRKKLDFPKRELNWRDEENASSFYASIHQRMGLPRKILFSGRLHQIYSWQGALELVTIETKSLLP